VNAPRTRLAWLAGGLAGFALLLVAWHVVYTKPRGDIQAQIDATNLNIAGLNGVLDSEYDLRKRGKAIGGTTLASKQDALEHRFRSGLSRIGEQEGLAGVVVDDVAPTDQLNPLKDVKGVSSSLKSALRRSPDFQLVRGTLKGTGTLEQVLRTVAVVQAQPWVHRVEGFTLKPHGQNREQLEVRLDVATLFAPELLGNAEPAAPQVAAAGPEAEGLWRAVALKNVFRKPAPAQARPVEVAQAPAGGGAAPQVFAPYEDWKLTGIMNGRNGTEAFFTNVKTGAKVTVPRGGQVLDAVLVDGSGEQVVVEIGGKKFVLSNGQTLAARRPQS
jgi:hypothetical protein